MNATKVKLSHPLEHNGTTYSELAFREACVGDFMAADAAKGEFSKMIFVLASISDVPVPAFKKMRPGDLARVMEATKDILGNGVTATGDASSP